MERMFGRLNIVYQKVDTGGGGADSHDAKKQATTEQPVNPVIQILPAEAIKHLETVKEQRGVAAAGSEARGLMD